MSKQKESSIGFDLLLGGASAGFSKTIVAPIERVKLLLQLQDTTKGLENPQKKFHGISDCFLRIYQEQGFLSFWRGNFSNVVRYFPAQALNFAIKDAIKKVLPVTHPTKEKWKSFAMNFAAGGLAGTISVVLLYPLDFIRTRLGTDMGRSAQDREFLTMRQVITKIVKSDGIFGIYRGLGASIGCAFIYRALYFGLFDSGKSILFEDFKNANLLLVWAFAQFVTTASGTISYPLDTVRRSLMMQSGRKEIVYNGFIDCSKKIYVNGGVKAFFKGGATNVLRGTGGALVLVIYNKVQAYFGVNAHIYD